MYLKNNVRTQIMVYCAEDVCKTETTHAGEMSS